MYHTTAGGGWHGKTTGLLRKRYSIFTRLLRRLYDFPPPVWHTPEDPRTRDEPTSGDAIAFQTQSLCAEGQQLGAETPEWVLCS